MSARSSQNVRGRAAAFGFAAAVRFFVAGAGFAGLRIAMALTLYRERPRGSGEPHELRTSASPWPRPGGSGRTHRSAPYVLLRHAARARPGGHAGPPLHATASPRSGSQSGRTHRSAPTRTTASPRSGPAGRADTQVRPCTYYCARRSGSRSGRTHRSAPTRTTVSRRSGSRSGRTHRSAPTRTTVSRRSGPPWSSMRPAASGTGRHSGRRRRRPGSPSSPASPRRASSSADRR